MATAKKEVRVLIPHVVSGILGAEFVGGDVIKLDAKTALELLKADVVEEVK